MEHLVEVWSLVIILLSAFVIGWAAETAQVFIPRAVALSILAWLQTLPEFAVEAAIAWDQQRDLMIANLTGSLRLIVGLGWPSVFFIQFFVQRFKYKKFYGELHLPPEDAISVLFLFISVLYFVLVWLKGSLTCVDSVVLVGIYLSYLFFMMRLPVQDAEDIDDLPWVGKKIITFGRVPRMISIAGLFIVGGIGIYLSVHPFLDTLQKWAVMTGISTFVFVQWVAPFLSEFPEYLTAMNWARFPRKAPVAVLNLVASNINQWTMLAAMIPIVFNFSLGRFEPVTIEGLHARELALTIAQSFLAGLLLLDLRLSLIEALGIFILFLVQFVWGGLREEITLAYGIWIAFEIGKMIYLYAAKKHVPAAIAAFRAGAHRKN